MSSSRKNCALRVWRPPGGNFICYRPSNWQQWSPAGGVYQWLYFSFFDSFLNAPTNPLLFSRKQQLTSVTDAITAKITHRSHTVESRRLNVSYWLLSSPTRSFLLLFWQKKTTNLCKLIGRPCVWIVWYWRQLGSRDLLTCTSIETLRSAGCTGHWNSFISYKALEVEAVKRLNVHKKPLHGRSVLETWKKF